MRHLSNVGDDFLLGLQGQVYEDFCNKWSHLWIRAICFQTGSPGAQMSYYEVHGYHFHHSYQESCFQTPLRPFTACHQQSSDGSQNFAAVQQRFTDTTWVWLIAIQRYLLSTQNSFLNATSVDTWQSRASHWKPFPSCSVMPYYISF